MAAGGKKWLEQMYLLVRRHTGAVVRDFEGGQLAVGIDKQLEPDLGNVVILGAVVPSITQQIVQNLGELVGVHQGGEIA
ncbi:hypothetical protein D3C80_2086200 [compost metagenome]